MLAQEMSLMIAFIYSKRYGIMFVYLNIVAKSLFLPRIVFYQSNYCVLESASVRTTNHTEKLITRSSGIDSSVYGNVEAG